MTAGVAVRLADGVIVVVHSGGGNWSWGWDSLVAIGTIGLALFTAWLAWTTRRLAQASRDDERAQWRPLLTPEREAPVQYDDDTGEMTFTVRNFGRGPAFGVGGQLRVGKATGGAMVPGTGAVVLAPGEDFEFRGRLSKPPKNIRGMLTEVTVSYYDITEHWHHSLIRVIGRRPPDKLGDHSIPPDLFAGTVFVDATDKRLLPVTGSPRARADADREQRTLFWQARTALSTRKSRILSAIQNRRGRS